MDEFVKATESNTQHPIHREPDPINGVFLVEGDPLLVVKEEIQDIEGEAVHVAEELLSADEPIVPTVLLAVKEEKPDLEDEEFSSGGYVDSAFFGGSCNRLPDKDDSFATEKHLVSKVQDDAVLEGNKKPEMLTPCPSLTEYPKPPCATKSYQCKYCEKVFSRSTNLINHLRIHSGEKPFKCHDCGRAFTQKKTLVVHIRTHSKEKRHQCRICERKFSCNSLLIRHQSIHFGEKPYECNDCSRKFTSVKNLNKHQMICKMYQCHVCSKRFSCNSTVIDLKREKPRQCKGCEKRSQKNLRTKKKIIKVHECSYCGRILSCNSALTDHLRTHTGEKPYQCVYCDKNFAKHSTLAYHLKTHTGEKPYQCKYCGRKFAHTSTLIRHTRTHTGEKPYKCECGKTFTRKLNLDHHLQNLCTKEIL